MLSYESFKSVLLADLPAMMPEQFSDVHFEIGHTTKVNVSYESLVMRNDIQGREVSPSINLEEIYQEYSNGRDLDEIETSLANTYAISAMTAEGKRGMIDDLYQKAEEKIYFQLINTEQNREMIKDIPHRDFMNLTVIYRLCVGKDENGIASTVVDHRLAARMGMDEEALFKYAAKNTKELFPVTIEPMENVLKEIMGPDIPEEMLDGFLFGFPDEMKLYVISNSSHINGAASILYEEGLHELAEKIENDLYIIPSSLHECLAISVAGISTEDIGSIVYEANRDVVDLRDRLSNDVYLYDRETRKLSQVTDSPYKRLDDMEPEPRINTILKEDYETQEIGAR